MANTAEQHWSLAAAHPLYAALLERVLAEVARQHIMKLELLAQVQQAEKACPCPNVPHPLLAFATVAWSLALHSLYTLGCTSVA